MRIVLFLIIVLVGRAGAQIPRTHSGMFEYSGEVSGGDTPLMTEKARSFFNQPFLVHWDSIARTELSGGTRVTGAGYITVRARRHRISLPGEVPVSLQLSIEVKEGRYRYTVNRFTVEKESQDKFPLEEKPDSVKSMEYIQVLEKTHRHVSFVIGWLKRYMAGQH